MEIAIDSEYADFNSDLEIEEEAFIYQKSKENTQQHKRTLK